MEKQTHTASLRQVGGSVMVALPPFCLDSLQLQAGRTVGITVVGGQLLIDPKPRPKYTLAELLTASDFSDPQPRAEREWVDAAPVGRELI